VQGVEDSGGCGVTDLESLDIVLEDAGEEALRSALGMLIAFVREMEFVEDDEGYSWIADKATYVLGEVERELTIS
jgi:hypothetical protein